MTTGWPVNLQHLLGRVDLWSGAGAQYHHGGGAGGGVHHHKEKMIDHWEQAPSAEAAFLGPQFWDKKISMKMFNNEFGWSQSQQNRYSQGGFDSDHSSPSPPHIERFQQNNFNEHPLVNGQSKQFPCNFLENNNQHTSNWLKDKEKSFKEESIEPNDNTDGSTRFHVSESDLALATVPGVDFDPTKRCFSAEELKPQPIIKKRKKMTTPENKKDDHYWARRSKNNFAAKRSREARRLKENQIALRASYLEKQNFQLKRSLKELHIQNSNMKVSVEALMAKIKEREADLLHV